MMASNEVVLLKSSLDIHCKNYSVKLTASEVYWEAATTSGRTPASGPYSEPLVKTENQSVKLCEIIAVHIGKQETKHEGKFQSVELESLSPTSFSLWVVRRIPRHRWRERKLTFSSRDTHIIQQWVDKIQDILSQQEFNRPKSLLVFINPFGGKQKATQMFRQKVAPLFDMAKVNYEVINTLRPNHARDTLQEYDLSKVDGTVMKFCLRRKVFIFQPATKHRWPLPLVFMIKAGPPVRDQVVSVGGDGMFVEILHGIMARTHRDNGMDNPGPNTPLLRPQMRIGIIPAGSTNAVIYSVHGTSDPVTSALHIILGDSVAMDVATVHHGNQFLKYNVSMLGYGYYGDCLLDSEQNRWMGPKRYDWAGFKKLMGNRVYDGEISYLPSPDKENQPQDKTYCKAGCTVCAAVASDMVHEPEIDITVKEEEDERKWQTVRGKFVSVNTFLISCRCHFSQEGPAPSAHLGDGCLDLVMIKECDRTDFFKYLYRCTKSNKDQFDFPFIQSVRVKEFKFRSLADDTEDSHADSELDGGQQRLRSRSQFSSSWNCDGEIIEEVSLDVRAHQQVIQIFGRGIEDDSRYKGGQCFPCDCGVLK